MKTNDVFFAWLDFETGGLNGRLDNGHLGMDYYPIFEVALIVTDSQLNQVGEALRLVINHSEERIQQSSEWAICAHTKSGLLDEVRSSKLSLKDVEHAIISHLQTLGIDSYDRKAKKGAVLAGSSIGFDRSYMMCQMPELNDYLHYRQMDVSSFNLAVRAFKPSLEDKFTKQYKHEALSDIQETIDEFKVYCDDWFLEPETNLVWTHDHVENSDLTEIGNWFLNAREVEPGLITLILTKFGFEKQHYSVLVKSSDFKSKAVAWAIPLIEFDIAEDLEACMAHGVG